MSREDDLRHALAVLRERVAAACAVVGRAPAEVTVVAVTKTFPAADVALLARLGVRDVGENRDQEARPKHAACAGLGLRWHFVGQLQRNKARSVASYCDVVHSVDSVELATALGAAALRQGRVLTALVQVSLDQQRAAGRGGAAPAAVAALAEQVATTPGLALGWVMGVAPRGGDPQEAFASLAAVAAGVRAAHPAATMLSAGMSADLEAAVHHGATHLRIGTALLGGRDAAVG